MTDVQKQTLRDSLLSRPVKELIEIIVEAQEELMEAKNLRRRLKQIENLCKDPEQRNKPGRPKKLQDK